MSPPIDRAAYATAPIIGVDSGITLVEQLVDVAKDDASPAIAGSVVKLREILDTARAAKVAQVRASTASGKAGDLQLDYATDRCLKAIKLRLEAWTLLRDSESSRRARELLALLYPRGLRFTRAAFAVQNAQMQRMLTEMNEPATAASLAELVGAPFITAFEQDARDYADMLKAMGRAVERKVDQRSVVTALRRAIVQHASRAVGELDDDDPKSVERVRRLLAPIDNFRARAGRGGGLGGGAEVEDRERDDDEPAP
ncbi:MAG: hypothetical protein AAGF11_53740 [Myxococcota bacterium]